MRQQILIINGAPRTNGNTDILVEKLIQGVAKAGHRSETLDLRRMQIGDCIGCYQCLRESTCSIPDDMAEARRTIETSNVLVFAFPIYWSGVPGLMKTFIDRLFFYYHPQNRPLLSDKRCLALAPLNQRNVAHETAPVIEFFERLCSCLGMQVIGMHFFNGLMDKNAIQQRPEYLGKAFEIGKCLSADS